MLVISLGRFGGVTEYGWLMSRALARHCAVAVVTSSTAENREKWSSLDVPHLEIDTFGGIPGMLVSLLSVRRFARMRAFARRFAPDIVYYPGGHAWKPLLDLVLPRSARVVFTVHDPDLHPGEDSLLFRVLDMVNRWRVHGYVLLNNSQRARFIERNGLDDSAVTVIPHGVLDDFPRDPPALSDTESLAPVARFAGSYLLFIGRIRRYKGIDTLLEAYRLLDVADAAPLVIAGDGEFSDRERRLVDALSDRELVVVNRWLSAEEIAALVASARFVVLPYTSATQSGVIPLASAFGVPAIASAAGGLAEQVVDGVTGMLFEVGDGDALAAVLRTASAITDEERDRMSAACRHHAENEWGWESLSGQLAEFMRATMDSGDRS